MLTIDRLRLSLPASFGNRAPRIARMLAEELAALPLATSLSIERLKASPVTVSPTAGDREVARAIAASVQSGLRKMER